MARIILLCCFLYFFAFVSAQSVTITGVVMDNSTLEGIPYVNILALPSNEGTTTDFEGNFRLTSTKKIKSIKLSYLGYETQVVNINQGQSAFIEVRLKENNIMIDEAVIVAKKKKDIPKDTAAVSLQQHVVDYKDKNRPSGQDSYHFKEHTKIEYDFYKMGEKFTKRKLLQPVKVIFDYIDTNETGNAYLPLLLQETITEHYYNKDPEKEKHITHAQYMTGVGNMSAAGMTDEIFQSFDLYDNTIIAGGKPFTSPFSVTGLVTYRYFLTDTMKKDGKNYYRLEFSPKNTRSIAFTGYAWIEDGTYALQSIEFKVPAKANLNFINDFYVKQSFSRPDGVNWFLQAEEIQIAVNIRKNKNKGSLLVKKRMSRGEVEINKELDPADYEGEKIQTADSVYTYDQDWWEKNRVEPLTDAEEGVVVMIDSIERTRIYSFMSGLAYLSSTAFIKTGPVEFGRFYKFVSWNQIEGIRPKLGVRTNKDFNKNIQLWGYAAYGTRDKEWKYYASARLKLPRVNQKWHVMQIFYQKDFTFLGQDYEDQLFSHDNFFLSVLRKEPLEKIMLVENFGFLYEKEWVKGFTSLLTINRTNFYAVDKVFEFEKPISATTTENIPRFGIMEVGLKAHVGIGERFFENDYYRFSTWSHKPIVDFSYKVGLKGLADGDYGYHKFEVDMYHRFSNKLGITKYNIKGGKILGNIPYPLMFLPIGNQGFYRNSQAYELMNEFEFGVDQYAAFWMYHHFDGKILNNIPLIKLLKFRSIFIFKGLVGNVSAKNQELIRFPTEMSPLNGYYMETGFGIENILKVVRLDFMWRLTQRNQPDIRKFGVRFAIDVGL